MSGEAIPASDGRISTNLGAYRTHSATACHSSQIVEAGWAILFFSGVSWPFLFRGEALVSPRK